MSACSSSVVPDRGGPQTRITGSRRGRTVDRRSKGSSRKSRTRRESRGRQPQRRAAGSWLLSSLREADRVVELRRNEAVHHPPEERSQVEGLCGVEGPGQRRSPPTREFGYNSAEDGMSKGASAWWPSGPLASDGMGCAALGGAGGLSRAPKNPDAREPADQNSGSPVIGEQIGISERGQSLCFGRRLQRPEKCETQYVKGSRA
jgi:hypothetical protein